MDPISFLAAFAFTNDRPAAKALPPDPPAFRRELAPDVPVTIPVVLPAPPLIPPPPPTFPDGPPPAAPAPPPANVAVAPPPTVWRLADVNGQVWLHADPAYLNSWVANRNAALQASRVPVYRFAYPTYSSCPSGRCYRGF